MGEMGNAYLRNHIRRRQFGRTTLKEDLKVCAGVEWIQLAQNRDE
jgi:hypothetical protein